VPQLLYIILLLFTGSLLCAGKIKTWPAQKLLVRVKFIGNPYLYVCEWPPFKYTRTRVCWNSYTGTRTVPDSYPCICECSLRVKHTALPEFKQPIFHKITNNVLSLPKKCYIFLQLIFTGLTPHLTSVKARNKLQNCTNSAIYNLGTNYW